jgi:small-conductance mechanosensitive channel
MVDIPIIGVLSETFLRIVFAILIFLFGLILGKLMGRVVYRMLSEIEINKFIKKSTGFKINADHIVSNFISYSIYFLAIVAGLEQVGIANIMLYLLSAAIIIILVISFFISIRDFIPNFLAGIYLYGQEKIKEGAIVEIDKIKGELTHIDLLHMKVKTKSGDIFFIPNSIAAKTLIKVKKR